MKVFVSFIGRDRRTTIPHEAYQSNHQREMQTVHNQIFHQFSHHTYAGWSGGSHLLCTRFCYKCKLLRFRIGLFECWILIIYAKFNINNLGYAKMAS